MQKKVLVLGCTGSIGKSTLDIIRSFPNLFSVCGLTAHTDTASLNKLAHEFSCNCIAASGAENGSRYDIRGVIENCGADIAVNGIAGSAGLLPSVWCLQNSMDLALANKETVVMAYDLIAQSASKAGKKIIPVDSEHSAVFTLRQKFGKQNLASVILTASGGPFRNLSTVQLKSVTLEQALAHPTWKMGKKISIDSATLANKGLEVIEACRLFNIKPEQVQVTIHPQSLVHSFIRTTDGDLYAQVSKPDMKRPILSALSWPNMIESTLEKLDALMCGIGLPATGGAHGAGTATGGKSTDALAGITMEFYPPRFNDFPLLTAAYEAQKKGGSYTIAYNAANEIAVELFLQRKIGFTDISTLVCSVLEHDWTAEAHNFDEVFYFDGEARKKARLLSGVHA